VASGAVHCQILDACHPGVVNMSKVNFDAKSEYDMVNNYKQLQAVFDKLKISRNIEVSKLVKGRPLDNLEFLQWMKYYYDTATGGVPPTDYDGEERRANCKGAAAMKRSTGGASSARASASRTAPPSRAAPSVAARRTTASTAPTAPAPSSATTNAKLAALQAENTELKLAVERTEQEREFYFEKLQDVEFLCQRAEFANQTLTKVVEKILYFTEGKPDVEAIIAECEAECRAAAPAEPAREPEPAEPALVATKSEEEEEEVTTPTVAEAAAVALELAAEEPAAPSSAETVAAAANEELDVTADADVTMTAASPLVGAGSPTEMPAVSPVAAPAMEPACAVEAPAAPREPLSPQPLNV
jgi:RP/EB family microtubule-associated protein